MGMFDFLKNYLPEESEMEQQGQPMPGPSPIPMPQAPSQSFGFGDVLSKLKNFLPEDKKGMEDDDWLGPEADMENQAAIAEYMPKLPTPGKEPYNYHDNHLRTPADPIKAKAAMDLQALLNPMKSEPNMSEMSPEQMAGIEPKVAPKSRGIASPKAPVAPKAEPSKEDASEASPEQKEKTTLESLFAKFDEKDVELEDAMKRRREELQLANLMEAAGTIGTAIGTGGKKTFEELNPNGFKSLKDMAQLRVDEVKEKRKAKQEQIAERQNIIQAAKGELDFHREEERNDPKSEASKMYREVIKAAMPELNIPENISASNLEKLVGPLQNAANMREAMESRKEIARMNADARRMEKEDRARRFNEQQAERYQKMATASPLYKDNITITQEIGIVKDLVMDAYQKGGQSVAALGTKLAKAMGEKGVLTENDVTRYITNPALAASILSRGKKKFVGKISKSDYDNLSRLVEQMNSRAQKNIEKAYEETATKFSRNSGLPLDEAKLLINPGLLTETPRETAEREKPYPRQVRNPQTGKIATVSNENELKEAQEEGFE